MEWRELLGAMGRFGFQDREASLYLLLLRRGRATARELTREAEVDRVIAEGRNAPAVDSRTTRSPRHLCCPR